MNKTVKIFLFLFLCFIGVKGVFADGSKIQTINEPTSCGILNWVNGGYCDFGDISLNYNSVDFHRQFFMISRELTKGLNGVPPGMAEGFYGKVRFTPEFENVSVVNGKLKVERTGFNDLYMCVYEYVINPYAGQAGDIRAINYWSENINYSCPQNVTDALYLDLNETNETGFSILTLGTATGSGYTISINGMVTDFEGYYEGYLTNLNTGFNNYTTNQISFSSGVVNNNLDDTGYVLEGGYDYQYDIFALALTGSENIVQETYFFSMDPEYIENYGTYELTYTGFTLNDVLIYNTGTYDFHIWDQTNDISWIVNDLPFSSGAVTDIDSGHILGWVSGDTYTIFSNINVGITTIEGPEYTFRYGYDVDIVGGPTYGELCTNPNIESGVIPGLTQFFYCTIDLMITAKDNVYNSYVGLKGLIQAIGNLGNTVEEKSIFGFLDFELIPSTYAVETYVYSENTDPLKIIGQANFESMPVLNNLYNLVKYVLIGAMAFMLIVYFFKPKQENG